MKDEILNTNGCRKCHHKNSFPNSSPCWKCIGINIDGDLYVTQTYFEFRHNELVERRLGRWIPAPEVGDCCYFCSECNFIRDAYILDTENFCPNCGARMVTEANEQSNA